MAMPDITGDEVAKEIKRFDPSLPVILLTGFGDILLNKKEKPAKVDYVLSKPTTRADLNKAIEKVIA